MIKTESMTINGISFVRTYSDTGHKVERDGVAYDEAIDPADTGRTYTESTEMIDAEESVTESETYMAGDRVTYGGKTSKSIIDNNVLSPGVYGWTEV